MIYQSIAPRSAGGRVRGPKTAGASVDDLNEIKEQKAQPSGADVPRRPAVNAIFATL
jgi:hypothetical protein